MKEFKFPSSSSPKVYTTLINDNGLLSCDCPGWTVKKLNKVRECKHTKKVALDEGLILEERDGQWFVVEEDGTSGQDRKSYSDTQDRKSYVPAKVSAGLQAGTSNPAPSQVTSVTSPGAQAQSSGFINPMLASSMPEGKTADNFDSNHQPPMTHWIMEEKFDGHRVVIRTGYPSGLAYAWSRPGNERTLPAHIHDLMAQMPVGVYDGELLVPGGHSYDVTAGQNSGQEVLVLFDMLETNGSSIMKEPFSKRREFLELAFSVLDGMNLPVRLAEQFVPSQNKVEEIWTRGGEGAIIKKLSGWYSPGWRSPEWIKVKAVASATLTITGFRSGKSGPHSTCELEDTDGNKTAVKVLDNATLRDIATKGPEAYIGCRLVISYHERTPSGNYRHPMWDHMAGVGE